MKTPNPTRVLGVSLIILLLAGVLRFVMADGCDEYWGCAQATVSFGLAASWTSTACPPASGQSGSPPVLTSKCACIEGDGGGHAAHLTFDTSGGGCQLQQTFSAGSIDINPGGTGCKSKITDMGCGNYHFKIYCPQHSGTVTVTARVTGNCVSCPDYVTNMCTQCTLPENTWVAVGTVQVQLTPEEEQDTTPCAESPDGPCGTAAGGCSGGCSGGVPAAGTASVQNDSLDFRLYLGRAQSQLMDAGFVRLYTNAALSNLADPSLLQTPFSRPGVQIFTNTSGVLQQVATPQILLNVHTINSYEYHLECYYIGDVTAGVNGYVTNGPPPFTVWQVKNPDGSSGFSRLWISEVRDGTTRTFQFTYTGATYRWDLLQPDQLTTTSSWWGPSGSSSNYFRQLTSNGQELRLTQETYQFNSTLSNNVLLQRIEGDGTTTRTNTYSYYSSGLLQRADHPDGSFQYYVYDSSGRVITNYSTFANYAAPPTGSVPNPASYPCKVTSYFYTLSAATDGIDDYGTNRPWVARKTIVQVPVAGVLQEISRKYCSVLSETSSETEECPNPQAKWGDAGNIYTYTEVDGLGKPLVVSRSDGTASIYSYSSDYSEVDEQSGEPDSVVQPSSILNGTYTRTFYDELGNITSRVVYSLPAWVTLSSQTYTYTDGSSNYLDPLRRSYDLVDTLANTTNQFRYNNCCGLSYSVNSDQVTTTYIYDNNTKRVLGNSKNVTSVSIITTTNLLDAAGRVLATMRVGSDGSLITLSQAQYDLLGLVVRETNALNGVTTRTNWYDATSGLTITTNIYPDGGTRIEMYSRDGQLNKLLGTAVAPVRYVDVVEQDSSIYRLSRQEIKLNGDGSDSSEWTKTYSDGAGQPYKTVYAPRPGVDDSNNPPAQLTYFNQYGKPWKQVDPDGVITFSAYNGKAELEYSIVALNSTTRSIADYDSLSAALSAGTIQSRNDRITQVERTVVAASGTMPDLIEVDTHLFDASQSTGTQVSSVQRSANNLTNWSTIYRDASTPVTTTKKVVPGVSRIETSIAPDGTKTVNQYQYGRLISSTTTNSTLGTLSLRTYAYDPHGRRTGITDARNGTTSFGFNNADQVVTNTTPPPAAGQAAQVTTTTYDTSLRAVRVAQPDGTVLTNAYAATSLLTNQAGSRVYPVAYTYDAQGRMKTLTTWTNYPASGAATTTWNYNAYRGWLDNKRYADSTGPDYTYTAGGRLLTRLWARTNNLGQRLQAIYTYGFNDGVANNEHGDLVSIAYTNDPQSTPTISYGYDRRGRQTTNSVGTAQVILGFDNANDLLSETNVSGTLAGLSVTNGYDQYLRRVQLAALNGTSPLLQDAYGYDSASRLLTVTDNTTSTPYSATYSYLANSPLISQITFAKNGSVRMTTTKQFDFVNRLTQIASAPTAGSNISFGYTYNSANQRTRTQLADGSYWRYSYDSIGQVTYGHKFFADQTPVAGEEFDYAFDTIGNRTQTKAGGDQSGANQRVANYSANNLNQSTSRDVPGYADILGLGLATSAVNVNGTTAYRKGEFFRQQLPVGNSSSAQWTNITVTETGQATNSGNLFLAKTPEQFSYDADGNLLSDGRWNYGWDAENRLIVMTNNNGSVGPQQVIRFAYDAKGRRTHKQVWGNNTASGTATNDLRFVYDGWNLLTDLNTNYSAVRTYMWGLDLGASMKAAGGVGGLLEVVYYASQSTNSFVAFDGNGNVAAFVNAADGTSLAQYEYGPFGELLRATGAITKVIPCRFSTKYQDDETDLLYYGYRYYSPSTGRWISRDPIEEINGLNVAEFSGNDAIGFVDFLGLSGLRFMSFGVAYANGPHWPYGDFERDGNWSGFQEGLDAWYWQTLQVINCPGGLCNSGTFGDSSSFIAAWVGNDSKCPVKLNCTCNVNANGSTFVPRLPGNNANQLGGLSTKGHVLDETFLVRAYPEDIGTSGWEADLGYSKLATKEFILNPGAKKELYHGHIDVSVGPIPGARIDESMEGTCSCTQE